MATEEWMLTDKEIGHLEIDPRDEGKPWAPWHTCARLAVKKYRDKLASQCGPEPCGECKAKGFCDAWGRLTDSQSECCGIYNQYLGTLTGYAKAMQEMATKLEAERAKAKAEGAWMVVDEMIAFLDCQGHNRPEGV